MRPRLRSSKRVGTSGTFGLERRLAVVMANLNLRRPLDLRPGLALAAVLVIVVAGAHLAAAWQTPAIPTATGIPFGFNATITRVIDDSTIQVTGGAPEKGTSATTTIRSFGGTVYHGPGGTGLGPAPKNFSQAGFGQGAPVTVFVNRDPLTDGTYFCVEIYFAGR